MGWRLSVKESQFLNKLDMHDVFEKLCMWRNKEWVAPVTKMREKDNSWGDIGIDSQQLWMQTHRIDFVWQQEQSMVKWKIFTLLIMGKS